VYDKQVSFHQFSLTSFRDIGKESIWLKFEIKGVKMSRITHLKDLLAMATQGLILHSDVLEFSKPLHTPPPPPSKVAISAVWRGRGNLFLIIVSALGHPKGGRGEL
jgi:hypothetical protein